MSLLTLIVREIRHRRGTFLLGSLGVAVAVAGVLIAAVLLERDRIETDALLAAKSALVEARVAARQAEVKKSGAELQDGIRKHMTKLGFNVLILPEQQNLSELHLTGTLTETIPEIYVRKLADSGIVTINHLLPMVTKRLTWPERNREIILVGTRGEVPILHRSEKKPLLDAVAPGQMIVGYELHHQLGLKPHDRVTFLDRELEVTTLQPQRGTSDDVTIWIDLTEAQKLLGLQNLIHGILALECECSGDRISQVRQEIQGILPGTQVIERYSQALARAEARAQASATAVAALAAEEAAGQQTLSQERLSRTALEEQHRQLAHWLVPATLLVSATWIGVLAWLNVRQRRDEIGILRAIGLSRRGILAAVEGKAVLIGLLGSVVGLAAAWILGEWARRGTSLPDWLSSPEIVRLVWGTPAAAVLLAAVASWLPAVMAANHDPARILEGE
ncbi:MAG: ABC transporter permease [Planctomycetaceae bacterium]